MRSVNVDTVLGFPCSFTQYLTEILINISNSDFISYLRVCIAGNWQLLGKQALECLQICFPF